jgi:predicted aconitase with swiveling domain
MAFDGRPLMAGGAAGPALVLDEPLSLWGGLDPQSGELIDQHHPQIGANLTGVVLVMPHGRGSSSASSVLAEAIRLETAPAAIVMREPDAIVVLGALVAQELYGRTCPVVVLDAQDYARLETGQLVEIGLDGTVRVEGTSAEVEEKSSRE